MASNLDFDSQLVLHAKLGKVKLALLTVSFEKCDFLQIDIVYTIGKNFFATSKNSRSLPQNEAPFGLDSLAKFDVFAQKYMRAIHAHSSGPEGTIVMMRSRGTYWNQELPSKLVGK